MTMPDYVYLSDTRVTMARGGSRMFLSLIPLYVRSHRDEVSYIYHAEYAYTLQEALDWLNNVN